MAKTKPKPIYAWGGFSDGQLHLTYEANTIMPMYAVYRTEGSAKLCYADVRRVQIIVLPRWKRVSDAPQRRTRPSRAGRAG